MMRWSLAIGLTLLVGTSVGAWAPLGQLKRPVGQRDRRVGQRRGSTTSMVALAPEAEEPEGRERAAASLPRGDALDRKIWTLTLPAVLNFLILPLTQATDLFWVGRLGDAMALAAQAAANQVFSSAFWLTSFIPTITTPLVAGAHAKGDKVAVSRHVGAAFFFSVCMGVLLTGLLASPLGARALTGVGNPNNVALAVPYLRARLPGVVADSVSTVGFSSFRGVMDVVTPFKVSLVSNGLNAVLDPLFMYSAKMGLSGAAFATSVSQIVAASAYVCLLRRRGMLRLRDALRPPSKAAFRTIAQGGAAIQIRALALNAAFVAITRRTQRLDATGTAAAAHAITIQLWQLGGVVLFAVSTVASIIVPAELNRATRDPKTGDFGGVAAARRAADRLLAWGLILGAALGLLQLAALPLLGALSPLPEVRQAARVPSIIGAALQLINGVTFIGEGLMVGTASFGALASAQVLATAAILIGLRRAKTLNDVWWCFWLFNGVRVANVVKHHFFTGPLAKKHIKQAEA